MVNNQNILTKEGLERLKKEYEELKNNKLPKAVERLSVARGQGDLTENSEYVAARDDLSFIEDRIFELEKILRNAKIVSSKKSSKTVEMGSEVTVKIDGEKETFYIVSDFESDPVSRKISPQSPIGMALMGKGKGDEVIVSVPAGKLKYKILSIE